MTGPAALPPPPMSQPRLIVEVVEGDSRVMVLDLILPVPVPDIIQLATRMVGEVTMISHTRAAQAIAGANWTVEGVGGGGSGDNGGAPGASGGPGTMPMAAAGYGPGGGGRGK
jgi:hypothetical protein